MFDAFFRAFSQYQNPLPEGMSEVLRFRYLDLKPSPFATLQKEKLQLAIELGSCLFLMNISPTCSGLKWGDTHLCKQYVRPMPM